MTSWLGAGLMAELDWSEMLQPLRQGFHREASDSNLVVILFAFLGLFVVVILFDQAYRFIAHRFPRRTTDYLAHATRLLALGYGDLRDLRTVAEKANFAHPAAMLLSPGSLAAAVRAANAEPRLRQRLNRLSLKVFGVALPPG
jgi:hypothetical protein